MEARMNTPTVYIGIVSYKSATLLPACLAALCAQTYAHTRIIIWDNAGENSVRMLAKRYRVRYIRSKKNVGYGSGHNGILGAITMHDTDYYLTVNPDALLEKGYVASLVRSARVHKAGWATGKLYKNIPAKELYSVGHAMFRDGYAFNIGYGVVDHGQFDVPREIFGAPGAAALYSARFVRIVARGDIFFDPLLFMYYEDIDIDWRGQLNGFSCWYEPNAVAIHPGGSFPRNLEGQVLVNRFVTVVKNATLRDLVLYNMPRIVLHMLARLVVTPRVGIGMIVLFSRLCGRAIAARENRSNRHMKHWFLRAGLEHANLPRFGKQRIQAFIERKTHD